MLPAGWASISGYDESLAHLIEAGADMFMMPSKFEPCGLNQMYSLRYGTVPIVRAVGGLDDTVENWDAVTRTGNGFKFGPLSCRPISRKDLRSPVRLRRPGHLATNSTERHAGRQLLGKRRKKIYRALRMDHELTTTFQINDEIRLRTFAEGDADAVLETVIRNRDHLMEFMHWMTPDYSHLISGGVHNAEHSGGRFEDKSRLWNIS